MRKYFLRAVALLLISMITSQVAFADGIADYMDEVNRILAQPNPEPAPYLSPSYYYYQYKSETKDFNPPAPEPQPSPAMQRLERWIWWQNRGYWQHRFQREWDQRQWSRRTARQR